MARLSRHLANANYPQDSTPFKLFDTYLSDYHSPALSHLCTHTYSKLEAVRQLAGHMSCHGSAADMVRALLTDRGLLFPQTREQFYTQTSHSWRRSMEYKGVYSRILQDMGVNQNTPFLIRAMTFACQAYLSRDCTVSFDRVSQALDVMLQACKGARFPQIVACEDVGYCKGELSALEQPSAPGTWTDAAAAEAAMETWLKTVQLSFDGQSTVSGGAYLRETLNFTVTEAFEFLSDILLPCIGTEENYQDCLSHLRQYEPVLYAHQESDWQQQVHCFCNEDLSLWRKALPALEQYLHPDLSRFGRDACPDNAPAPDCSPYVDRLRHAFEVYLKLMEPQNKTMDTETIAAYFVSSVCGVDNEAPLFMDAPSIIFHLFRSPVFRYFYQYEDRGWNLYKTVENACIRFPLPVTSQSLDADQALYLDIVDACAGYCRAQNVTFDAASWRTFWPCLQQCVMCLSFQMEDLFTVQYSMRNLMRFRQKGYPILDQFLSDKLQSTCSSAYIQLWRTLLNKKMNGKITSQNNDSAVPADKHRPAGAKEKRLNQLLDTVSAYRSLFEHPETDVQEVVQLLLPLCSELKFNRISFLPDNEEWKEIAQQWDLLPRSESGPIHEIKTTRTDQAGQSHVQKGRRKTMNAPRTVELILAEWLLLQWSCTQAQREMMTVIDTLLRE